MTGKKETQIVFRNGGRKHDVEEEKSVCTGRHVRTVGRNRRAQLCVVQPRRDGSQDVLASANFFTAYRALRTSTRNEEILYLDSIIGTTGDEFAEQRAQAAEDKMKLVKNMELELTLESLIKGKGYQDVYVAVGSGSDNLHIFVNTAELTTQDAAIIYTIAMEEAGKTPDEVKIIPLA